MSKKLKPCPFCGGAACIGVRDDEGNVRGMDYEDSPYSGLCYVIEHDVLDCPASHEVGGEDYLFRTYDEAVDTWNHRAEITCTYDEYGDGLMVCSMCRFRIGGWDSTFFDCESGKPEFDYCPGCRAKVVGR